MSSSGSTNNPQSAIRNPKSILIVDDSPDDIEITRLALKKAASDVSVRSAESGEHAMRFLHDSRDLPSLIFVDLKMCGMSGIDMVRLVRADERMKHIPLIILTNSSLESDMRKAYDAGANSFIHKAFDMDKFGREIKTHLECWLK